MFTSSGSAGGGGNAFTIISPNTSFGDIIIELQLHNVTMQQYQDGVVLL